MKCQKCKIDFPESEIHEHHIHPRFMDNKKGNGMKCCLCKKHHNILHFKIPGILWKYIPENKKKEVIELVEEFTKNYIR